MSAVPFFTSVTGVLQLGQARMSRSSGSTGMTGIYDTFALLWNNSRVMKAAVLIATFSASMIALAGAEAGQARQPSSAPPPAAADKTAEAYDQFLLGLRYVLF